MYPKTKLNNFITLLVLVCTIQINQNYLPETSYHVMTFTFMTILEILQFL